MKENTNSKQGQIENHSINELKLMKNVIHKYTYNIYISHN